MMMDKDNSYVSYSTILVLGPHLYLCESHDMYGHTATGALVVVHVARWAAWERGVAGVRG